MIIVHAHHSYLPVRGGMEVAISSLAREQAKRGHEVHVITAKGPGLRELELINGVWVHRVRAAKLGLPDLTYPREVPRELLKKADVVHAHSQNSLFSVRLAEEAHRLGIPVAFHFMAVNSLRDHPNPVIRLLGPYYASRQARRALSASKARMAKSPWDLEQLKAMGVNDALLVPDGVSDALLSAPRSPGLGRSLLGFNNDMKYFVYVGRLHRLKGVHVLIRALALALRERKDLALAIVGPGDQGPYRELARRLGVSDRVRFTGFVGEEDKARIIDDAVALVVPSLSDYVEAYSIAASEAWARERPVIASDVGALRYRVRDGVNGLLVRRNDPGALARAMVRLASDEIMTSKMGQAGRASEVYSWAQVYEMAMKAYQLALNRV